MNHLIPQSAIARYAAAPSDSTVAAVKSLHESIRETLGDGYETFLQGSYRNDTGVADLNDVDIVAVRTSLVSGVFTSITSSTSAVTWDRIFQDVQDALESSRHYKGKTTRGDKCITVNTNFSADVVPAVKIAIDGSDPIAIYSFRERAERKNYPRVHYQNNVSKQARTSNAYKQTVRLFKRWARNWFAGTKVAPSFYVECLVYRVPDHLFVDDGATSFFLVGNHIVENMSSSVEVLSVAGDKDILVSSEWDSARYATFRRALAPAITLVAKALQATSAESARTYWQQAFNE